MKVYNFNVCHTLFQKQKRLKDSYETNSPVATWCFLWTSIFEKKKKRNTHITIPYQRNIHHNTTLIPQN